MLIHWFSRGCESISEHPINGRKCKAYWVSRNGIKHLKAQHDRYNKARDLYFELLNMELGRTSDNTFETTTGLNNTTTLVHRPVPVGLEVGYNPLEGTLAVVEDDSKQCPVSTVNKPIEEVINIKEENGEILISGRELHEFLEIGLGMILGLEEC